jgi:hypothetical protein
MGEIDTMSALPVGRYRLKKKQQRQDQSDTQNQSDITNRCNVQDASGQDACSVPPTPIEVVDKAPVQGSTETSHQIMSIDEGIYQILRWRFRELRKNGILIMSDLDQVRVLFSIFTFEFTKAVLGGKS